ncbi:MAG: OmpH family outer membrane protein, partial [Chromatiales bacterium]|nr:OmpH family outer membrane protein [Chromatiales bacterium]
ACFLMFSGSALAQSRIGVVNIARLLEESPQAQTAMQALQDEFAPRQRQIVARQTDIQSKEEVLRRDGAVMSEEERRNADRELREMQRDLQRNQQEYLEDLNLRRNEELGRLQRSLLQEVQT